MVRQFSHNTCISMSLELNCHLSTPFPAMNKGLPLHVVDTEELSKVDITKRYSSNDDVANDDVTGAKPVIQCQRMADGELNLLATQLMDTLQKAVFKRVTSIPDGPKCFKREETMCFHSEQHSVVDDQVETLCDAKVAILYSGGVDSMILAALTDR